MVIGIIGMLIGLMVAALGIYYLIQEKEDRESQKIYGIISAIGGLVFIAMLLYLILFDPEKFIKVKCRLP